jgi:8-oxo-dGTP diphosphatase
MGEPIIVTDAVVISPDGSKVLLGKNVKNAHVLVGWILPGGKLEKSETLEECAVREIFEETGVRIKIDSHIATFVGSASINGVVEETYVIVGFLAYAESEKLEKSPELKDLKWFPLEALPDDLYPDSKRQIILALKKRGIKPA